MSSRRLSNRRTLVNYAPTSSSSLVGLYQLDKEDEYEKNPEETTMNESTSRRRRQSALSLVYSVDEYSRSPTFISSAETQIDDYELEEYDGNISKKDEIDYEVEDDDEDDEDDENRFQNPYYHPALPTPMEDPVPPPAQPQSLTATTVLSETREETESTTFQKFLSSPIEFIFGGNADDDDYDDDVSTLDGGYGGESVHWLGTNEEDSSTIRTTPTLQSSSQYKIHRNQPMTIFENDENEDDNYDGDDNYEEYPNKEEDPNHHPSSSYGTSYHDPSHYSQSSNDGSNSLYPSKESTDPTSPTFKTSKVRFGMMDEDVLRQNHVEDGMGNQYLNNIDDDEDVSISLSTALGQSRESFHSTTSHDPKKSIPKTNTMTPNFHHLNSSDHSYSQQSSSTGSNSAAIRRALDANKSWRSIRSKNYGTNNSSSSSISIHGGGGAGSHSWSGRPSLSRGDASVRSFVSLLPETPEVIPNPLGGPVMTRGMSGRAVVHVQLDSARDGSITRLDYTMPIVDNSFSSSSSTTTTTMQQRRDEFHDEYDNNNDDDDDDNTVVMENKARNPWKEMYLQSSKFMRTWYSRKFQRILAMALLGIALLLTITISMTALLSEEPKSSTSTSRSTTTTTNTLSATASSTSSLHGLFAPPKIGGVTIPNYMDSNLKEWYVPNQLSIVGKDDVPYFFSIPHSGAQLVSECWTHCLGLTLASNGEKIAGADDVDGRGTSTRNATTLRSIQFEGATFVNVDLSTPEGIENAGSLNLIPSSIPDIVISPLFVNVLQTLYSSQYPTTLLMIMRHPVDRTVAKFESWKKSQAETTADPTIAMMSIEQYALSGYVENNYVIRLLTGKYKGRLTNADVDYCKEILRRKAVLGLYENMEGTILHFQQYFGWGAIVGESDSISLLKNCQMPFVEDGLKRDSATKLDPGSSAYSLIQHQNLHDMALYQYIRNVLIPFQTEMLSRQRQESLS